MTNQIKRDFLLGFLSTSSLNISSIFLFSHHLASFLAAGDHLDMQSQPPNTSCRTPRRQAKIGIIPGIFLQLKQDLPDYQKL
jgi:hypothetical protein